MNGQVPSIDALTQRVLNTEKAVGNLESQFTHGFAKLESQFTNGLAKIEGQIALDRDRQAASQRPQWQLYLAFLGTMTVLGGGAWSLAAGPIRASIETQGEMIAKLETTQGNIANKLESAMIRLGDAVAVLPQTYLSKEEYAGNRLQARQDLDNRFAAIADELEKADTDRKELRDTIVPRGEHEDHWRAQAAAIEAARQERMVQIESLEQQNADKQRQIDEVKKSLGEIYGARDVIRDLQSQVQALYAERMRQ